MLRGFTAFVLCAVLAFPWVSKVAITADFVIHQDYIAQNLCENRDKPDLHCNGTCVLMQKLKLKKDTSNEPRELPKLAQTEISSFLVIDFDFAPLYNPESVIDENLPCHSKDIKSLYLKDIFHPPRFSA